MAAPSLVRKEMCWAESPVPFIMSSSRAHATWCARSTKCMREQSCSAWSLLVFATSHKRCLHAPPVPNYLLGTHSNTVPLPLG